MSVVTDGGDMSTNDSTVLVEDVLAQSIAGNGTVNNTHGKLGEKRLVELGVEVLVHARHGRHVEVRHHRLPDVVDRVRRMGQSVNVSENCAHGGQCYEPGPIMKRRTVENSRS